MSQHPFITEIFPGLIVDIFHHEGNPAAEPEFEHLFNIGYWELVVTVTEENFCVLPETYKALLVVPTCIMEACATELFALYPIERNERILDLSYTLEPVSKGSRVSPVDTILIRVGRTIAHSRMYALEIEHNKDGLEVFDRMMLQ